MIASTWSAESRTAVGDAQQRATTPPIVSSSGVPVSVVTLIASIGVFIASVGYTAGRLGYSNSPWANRAYWFGQALILIPIAKRLFSRSPLTGRATVTLLVVLGIAEYILKVCYSPLGFTFADELLHWRGTVNLLQTGDPFTINYGIPIGPHYPGLELTTSALISSTGLSVFCAGLIVAGLSHLLFICLLYLTFLSMARSHRIAGIAIFIYFGTPDFTSFNSMFVYETLALAFLGLAVLSAFRTATETSRRDRIRWFVIAVLSIMATIITHHVTSYMLAAFLILVALNSMITGHRHTKIKLGSLAVISVVGVTCWIVFIAPDTISYFSPTAEGIVQGLNALLGSGSSSAPSTSLPPLGDQLLEGLDILVVGVLLVLGVWQVWRRQRHHPWIVATALGSLGWLIALALRLGTPDGQELAGRTAAFVLIPVSLIAALALFKFVNSAHIRRWKSLLMAVAAIGALTLIFDGLANGWPPYYERLPGPHQVAGFERSIDPEEIATANWVLSALGPGNNIAADIGIYPALAGYGNQNALHDIAYLYTSSRFTLSTVESAKAQDVQYVLVDRRLSESLPVSGHYFPGDTNVYKAPIPLADLTKFDDLPGVKRLYDDGNIVIYDLQGLPYVP